MRDDSRLIDLLNGFSRKLKVDPTDMFPVLLPIYDLAARDLLNIGCPEEAVWLERMLKPTLAPDYAHQLSSLHELAIAYQANGQYKDAVELAPEGASCLSLGAKN